MKRKNMSSHKTESITNGEYSHIKFFYLPNTKVHLPNKIAIMLSFKQGIGGH